jgi:hypothetical protein
MGTGTRFACKNTPVASVSEVLPIRARQFEAPTVTAEAEPNGEYDELGEKNRFHKAESVVVSGVSKQEHSRQSRQYPEEQRIVAVVSRFEKDRALGRHLGGYASGKVSRNSDFRYGVERTSQTQVKFAQIEFVRRAVLIYWLVVHAALLSCGWRFCKASRSFLRPRCRWVRTVPMGRLKA